MKAIHAVPVPDFENQYRSFQIAMDKNKSSRLTTVVQPFTFDYTIQASAKNTQKLKFFSLVPPVIRRKTSSASAGGGSPGSKSLHLSPLSNNNERHPRKSQTLFTFPDPGTLSAGSGQRHL